MKRMLAQCDELKQLTNASNIRPPVKSLRVKSSTQNPE